MNHQRTTIRRSSIIAASLLIALVAGCGSESSSSRTLNSIVCFDTPEEKEVARAEADQALQEAAPLITNNDSAIFNDASGGGYRVPARRVSSADTTTPTTVVQDTAQTNEETSTTVPDSSSTTVSDSSSTTVADTESTPAPENGVDQLTLLSQQLQAIIDTPLCSDIEQNSETAAADEVSSESEYVEVDCPVEASINADGYLIMTACSAVDSFSANWNGPEGGSFGDSGPFPASISVGDGPVVLTLYAGEHAVFSGTVSANSPVTASGTYFALASSEDNGDESDTPADVLGDEVPEGVEGVDYEMCSLSVTDNTATVECAYQLFANLFYQTASGRSNLMGWADITFGPIDDVEEMSIAIWQGGVVVFNGIITDGFYEFRVDLNSNTEPEPDMGEDEEDNSPLFEGFIDPFFQTEFTFSANDEEPFFAEFYAPCDEQTIEAQISLGEASESFEEMPPYALNEDLCGVWLEGPIDAGEYTITLTAQTDHIIRWSSTHDIFAAIRSSIDYQVDRGTTSVPIVNEFDVPEGGRWYFAEGNSNIGCPDVPWDQSSHADPYLLLLDSNDDVVIEDDESRSTEFDNCNAAGFEIFLKAGTYRLVATTYDLVEPNNARPNAETEYELVYGLQNIPEQAAISDPITLDESVVNALPIAELATPTDKQNAAAVPSPDVLSQDQAVSIALTSDTKNMVCNEACIEQYFDAADITEGTITLSFGDAKVSASRGAKRLLIPVNSRSNTLSVTVASADGSASTDFTSTVVVMSPKNSPMAVPSKEIAKQSANKDGSLPWIPVAGGILVLVAVGAVMQRRRGVA